MDEEFLNEIKEEEVKNEIVEIEDEELNNTSYDIPEVQKPLEEVKKEKKKRIKKPSKWSKLTKKQKIIVVVVASIILLLIIGLLVYFLVIKKNKEEVKEPVVIVEKENYRYEDGKLIFLDEDKKELGEYTCVNKDEDLCYVAYYTSEEEFDEDKKVYEDGTNIDITSDIILDKYVFVYDSPKKKNGEITLYNIDDKKSIEKYNSLKEVNEEMVIVKKDNKYGVLSFTKKKIDEDFKIEYDFIGHMNDTEYLVVADNNSYSLYNYDGKSVTKSVNGIIKSFDENNLSVSINGKYYVYGYDGNELISNTFDYIRFESSYIIGISSNKVYVFDKTGAPMNIDGIKIKVDDYNTKLIFNKELRQIDKKETFSVTVNDKQLKIDLKDDKPITINLNEGIINKNLPYYSYFAGKLYFYSDEAKQESLGSYTCSYANAINNNAFSNNCFIAKESNILDNSKDNSFLPIYNNRFIFITDTKTPDGNDNIILYDLKDNKKLATYKMVDLNYHVKNDNAVTFENTNGTYVLAKNTSDSYGLVNITNKNVLGVIPFKNKDSNTTNVEVKALGDYLVFKRSDDTYHIYDYKGTELAPQINTKNEIVEYKNNYIKVKTNAGNYMLYGLDGKIISDEYKAIITDTSLYITVDNKNKIGVFKYNNKTNLVNKDIEVAGKNIEQEIKYGFRGNILLLTIESPSGLVSEEINIG